MAATVSRDSVSSPNVYAPRRLHRIVLWAVAVVVNLYCLLSASVVLLVLLGIPDRRGIVLLLSFPLAGLLILFQFLSGRSVTFGWIISATLCGALLACMAAPTVSHGPLNYLWAAQQAFWGALAGMAGGSVVCLVICGAQIRIRHLMELTAACALLMLFWTFYSEASARNDSWNSSFNRSLPTMRIR